MTTTRDTARVAEDFREAIQDAFFFAVDPEVTPVDGGAAFEVRIPEAGGTFKVTVTAAGGN